MPNAIEVRGLGKMYRIGSQQQLKQTFREALIDTLKMPYRRLQSVMRNEAARDNQEDFWALRDVSFDVAQGEVIGVIGRNGAGKSTLLKILSEITVPTEGEVRLQGRVGSLLEVGTGFHPELTGRENVYLNGSILGMTRSEIDKKFDDIVQFAEMGKFIDTSVKHYSSGMSVRLAFSVAAHIEPEILLVDEVLAVGDVAFQKRSLEKTSDVALGGRTVLFVSHNMGIINRLCQRCILLDSGQLVDFGSTDKMIEKYLDSNLQQDAVYTQPHNPDKPINLRKAQMVTHDGIASTEFRYDQPIKFEIEFEVNESIEFCQVWASIRTMTGEVVIETTDFDTDAQRNQLRKKGYYQAIFRIPEKLLNTSMYNVIVSISSLKPPHTSYDRVEMTTITIINTGSFATTNADERAGIIKPMIDWQTQKLE